MRLPLFQFNSLSHLLHLLLLWRCVMSHVACTVMPTLASWTAETIDKVGNLMGSVFNKSFQLDLVPMQLAKGTLVLLSPFVALLFNKSLITAAFIQSFRRPLLSAAEEEWGLMPAI